VRVVHGLERDAGVIAIEVAVVHELFDCFDDLGEESEKKMLAGECFLANIPRRVRAFTFFRRLACSNRASNTV
jgi:hypothetical protein